MKLEIVSCIVGDARNAVVEFEYVFQKRVQVIGIKVLFRQIKLICILSLDLN